MAFPHGTAVRIGGARRGQSFLSLFLLLCIFQTSLSAHPQLHRRQKKDSSLCCPLSGVPDPKRCTWRGTAPSCNGHCHTGEVTLEYNKWGDGEYCEDGQKVYCCEQTADEENNCYWTGVGDHCRKGDEPLTFAGTFLEAAAETIAHIFPFSLVGAGLNELFVVLTSLGKRGEIVGPLMKLPPYCFFCPSVTDAEVEFADGIDESDELDDPESVSKRDISGLLHYNLIEKRAKAKKISFCDGNMEIVSPRYDHSGDIVQKQKSIKIYGYKNSDDFDDYDFGLVHKPILTRKYATEHILEFQLLKIFLEAKSKEDGLKWKDAEGDSVDLCHYMKEYWAGDISLNVDGEEGRPIELLPKVFSGRDNMFVSEFVLLDQFVNGMKERMWSGIQLVDRDKMKKYVDDNDGNNIAFKKMRDIISAWKYHQDGTTRDILRKQSDRVAAVLDLLEGEIVAKSNKKYIKIGLKDEWNRFIKGRVELARAGAEEFLDRWLKYMNDVWTDGGDKDKDKYMDMDMDSDTNNNMWVNTNSKASRLAKLINERKSMGVWSSPF